MGKCPTLLFRNGIGVGQLSCFQVFLMGSEGRGIAGKAVAHLLSFGGINFLAVGKASNGIVVLIESSAENSQYKL